MMPDYSYIALDEHGKTVRGTLSAQHRQAVRQKLEQQNYWPVSIKLQHRFFLVSFASNLTINELVQICFQLKQLLQAGMPMIKGVEHLKNNSASIRLRRLFSQIHIEMGAGKSFSEACHKQAKFPSWWLGLIKLGETSGSLENSLSEMESLLIWQQQLQRRLRKIIMYPLVSSLVVISVVVLMSVWIVPQIQPLIISTNQGQISWSTQSLFWLSAHLRHDWQWFVALFLGGFTMAEVFKRLPLTSIWWSRQKLNIPLIGLILRAYHTSFLSRNLALLLQSGMNLNEALQHLIDVIQNKSIRHGLIEVQRGVLQGHDLPRLLSQHKVIPEFGVKLLEVGYKSGDLHQSLSFLQTYYWNELEHRMHKLEPLIEPFITLILGLMIIWLVIAVMNPIYSLMTQVA
jgi:type IV pilus assembly protein PilC